MTSAGFDRARCEAQGFIFSPAQNLQRQSLTFVALTGTAPKLLESDVSTADQPILCWCFRVRGTTALEIGAIPNDPELLDDPATLHLRMENSSGHQPAGIFSSATTNSELNVSVPVVKGSVVEVVASRGSLRALVRMPQDTEAAMRAPRDAVILLST